MRACQVGSALSLQESQVFAILGGLDGSNYMRANKITDEPILENMPGPWGKALERLRLSQPKLSKKALAKRARMTPTTYGHIESGGHTHTRKLQDLADALHVPIEAVLMPPLGTSRELTVRELVQQYIAENAALELARIAAPAIQPPDPHRASIDAAKRSFSEIHKEDVAGKRRRSGNRQKNALAPPIKGRSGKK